MQNELSKKEMDALDRQMERLESKIVEVKHKYEALVSEYAKLREKRHPEKKAERIKETLYQAYVNSERSLEQILAYMSGEDDEW